MTMLAKNWESQRKKGKIFLRDKSKRVFPNSITYYLALPNIKSTVAKHWVILQVNLEFKEKFQEATFIAYHRNSNLKVGSRVGWPDSF